MCVSIERFTFQYIEKIDTMSNTNANNRFLSWVSLWFGSVSVNNMHEVSEWSTLQVLHAARTLFRTANRFLSIFERTNVSLTVH